MDLDQDLHRRANRLTHRANPLHGQVFLRATDMRPPRVGERVEFEGSEAPGDHLTCALRVLLGRPRLLGPAVGVDANAGATRPAEQVVHGLAARLTGDVPHCLLERA